MVMRERCFWLLAFVLRDRETFDVVAAPGKQADDAREQAGFVSCRAPRALCDSVGSWRSSGNRLMRAGSSCVPCPSIAHRHARAFSRHPVLKSSARREVLSDGRVAIVNPRLRFLPGHGGFVPCSPRYPLRADGFRHDPFETGRNRCCPAQHQARPRLPERIRSFPAWRRLAPRRRRLRRGYGCRSSRGRIAAPTFVVRT